MDRNAIEEIISRRLCDFETAVPGKVTNVAKDGTLSVMPLIKKVTVDGIVDVDNLSIEGIKPFVVGNSNAAIDIEISEGSQVLLVGLSRHAMEWLGTSSDDAVIPRSAYGNMLNDLVAIPLFRTDRDNGLKSKVFLGKDGEVEIKSAYGQSLKFNSDGSIDIAPKSGKTIKFGGSVEVNGGLNATDKIVSDKEVEGTDFKAGLLSFNTHVHAVKGVTPGSGSATSGAPSSPPAP